MAKNNPAMDRYNPPSNMDSEYEIQRFSELNIGELIWLSDVRSDDNHSFRKISESEAMDTHTRKVKLFKAHDKVYYRM